MLARLASLGSQCCAAPPPAAPPLIFCARDFLELRSHILPQIESAKMVEIGRSQAGNFRFHREFSFNFSVLANLTEERNQNFSGGNHQIFFSPPLCRYFAIVEEYKTTRPKFKKVYLNSVSAHPPD